ncbi:unnamed protein product [Dibothriocephalus latus]|uniref:GST N-terminal domain-containing protein n=1 Tax=Dibothriocephalus latus TaxID=60516 RepID=A0A3P6V8I5_DIBLA|nr:unnamed protein product [Dibothriocephalus latus]
MGWVLGGDGSFLPTGCANHGDPEPSVNPENVTLYDMQFCPYCQRVRYTLDYHKIPYDRILIDLMSKPSWYLKMYPVGKVPLLLYRGKTMAESDVIMKYCDQMKGAKASLLSVCGEEGFKRALNLTSSVSLLLIALLRYKLLFSPDVTRADADSLKAALSNLDKAIQGPYLMDLLPFLTFEGKELSLADLALFPFLHAWDLLISRLKDVGDDSDESAEPVAPRWPNVLKYCQLMNQKPFIMKTAFRDDEFSKYMDTRLQAARP